MATAVIVSKLASYVVRSSQNGMLDRSCVLFGWKTREAGRHHLTVNLMCTGRKFESSTPVRLGR